MKLKQKIYSQPFALNPLPSTLNHSQRGFTIIELLVVLAIMGLFMGAILVNFAGNRGARNLRLSTNELVTNLRKVQSYVLSSRDSSVGPVKYYVLQFNTEQSRNYYVQAIQNDLTFTNPIETVELLPDIRIASIEVQQPYGSSASNPTCVQVGFALPFNIAYVDQNCSLDLSVRDPATLSNLDDSLVIITLQDPQSGNTKTVTINGVSGVITSP